ncbi:MAG: hypothetical protein CMF96_11590 [Candidatus Marinimicrobia bacterium]|nr:hypothetical protein [Candidatus Neomarinimicrobiota bacterium]
MTFLSPFFLFLLPLISIPTLIHLWNKYRVKEIEFSTIIFLKILESKSIKKVKLVEILLLFIRTLIILLLIFFISRPIIKGQFADWVNNPESTVTAIIIDDSFSMNGIRFDKNNLDLIKIKVNEIKNNLIDKQFVLFGTFSNGIQFLGLKEEFEKFELVYRISDLNIGYEKIFDQIKDTLNQGIINKELYLLTDIQENSFKIRDEYSNFKSINWNTFIIDFDLPSENLSINLLEVESEIILPNEPFDIKVKVSNNGKSPQFQRLISLNIDGIDVGQELISLQVNEEKEVYFKTALPSTGDFKITAKLDQDDLINDNEYIRVLTIPKNIKIGLYSKYPEDMIYLNHTLNAINQDNDLFSISNFSLNQLGVSNLKQYDVLFISGVVDKNTWNKIENFCQYGKHAIVFPSTKENKYFNNDFVEINPVILKDNDYISTNKSILDNVSDISLEKLLINKLTSPRYFKYYGLKLYQNSLVQLENNVTIWDRRTVGTGFIDKLGIGLTADWSNLPIIAGFIPFLHNWIYSGNTVNSKVKNNVGDEVNKKVSTSINEYVIKTPSNDKYLLPANQNGFLNLFKFEKFGWYELLLDGESNYLYAVNNSEDELNIKKIDKDRIDLLFPNNKIISPIKEIGEEARFAKIGTEIGSLLLIIIIILLIVEMFLAHFQSLQGKNN